MSLNVYKGEYYNNYTVQPEILAGIKFGGLVQDRHTYYM